MAQQPFVTFLTTVICLGHIATVQALNYADPEAMENYYNDPRLKLPAGTPEQERWDYCYKRAKVDNSLHDPQCCEHAWVKQERNRQLRKVCECNNYYWGDGYHGCYYSCSYHRYLETLPDIDAEDAQVKDWNNQCEAQRPHTRCYLKEDQIDTMDKNVFSCACQRGLREETVNGTVQCVEIKECEQCQIDCFRPSRCVNENPTNKTEAQGAYNCICGPGFRGNAGIDGSCNDINECKEHNDFCATIHADCYNTIPFHVCSCKTGWKGINNTGIVTAGDYNNKKYDLGNPWGMPNDTKCEPSCPKLSTISNGKLSYHAETTNAVLNINDYVELPTGVEAKVTCDPGYAPYPYPNDTAVCILNPVDPLSGGIWSNDLACKRVCEQLECAGECEISCDNNDPSGAAKPLFEGTNCSAVCAAGHTLIGENSFTCTSDGTWSPAEPPTCGKTCDVPGPIANADSNIDATPVNSKYPNGSVLSVTCQSTSDVQWYLPQCGNSQTTGEWVCIDGIWKHKENKTEFTSAECIPGCSKEVLFEGGKPTIPDRWCGAKGTLRCAEGFTMFIFGLPYHDELDLTCKSESGLGWIHSPYAAECRQVCSRLTIENGQSNITDYAPHQSIGKVLCNDGHYLVDGSDIAACLNGQWKFTYGEPKCVPGCPVDMERKFATIEYSPSKQESEVDGSFATVGTVAELKCAEGRLPSGPVTKVKCLNNGQWNDSLTTCVQYCEELIADDYPNVIVTYHGPGQLLEGTIAVLSCKYEKSICGPRATAVCKNGTWLWNGDNTIVCPGGCEHFDIPNAHVILLDPNGNAVVSPGELVLGSGYAHIRCNYGYVHAGCEVVQMIKCIGEGTQKWEREPNPCVPSCAPIIPPRHSTVIYGTNDKQGRYINGTKATVACNEGFEADPCTVTIECIGVDEWSGELPNCKKRCIPKIIECGKSRILIDKTKGIKHGIVAGNKIEIACDEFGYHVRNENEFECRGVCPDPPQIENGTVTTQKPFLSGLCVDYRCKEGYFMRGGQTCSKFCCVGPYKTYPTKLPSCVPGCETFPVINGYFVTSKSTFAFGESVQLKCHDGHRLKYSNDRIMCVAPNRWSKTPEYLNQMCKPVCDLRYLGIEHGALTQCFSGNRVFNETSIRITCHKGFAPTFNGETQCIGVNEWSPHVQCLRIIPNVIPNVCFARTGVDDLTWEQADAMCHSMDGATLVRFSSDSEFFRTLEVFRSYGDWSAEFWSDMHFENGAWRWHYNGMHLNGSYYHPDVDDSALACGTFSLSQGAMVATDCLEPHEGLCMWTCDNQLYFPDKCVNVTNVVVD